MSNRKDEIQSSFAVKYSKLCSYNKDFEIINKIVGFH